MNHNHSQVKLSLACLLFFITTCLSAQTYQNFSTSWNWSLWTTIATGGGGGVYVDIENDILTVRFSGGWTPSPLTTNRFTLNTSPTVPNMVLGELDRGGYIAKIEGGQLYVDESNETINGFNTEFVVSLNGSLPPPPPPPPVNINPHTDYVNSVNVSAYNGASYYYTESVTLKDGFTFNGADGEFFVSPVSVNPSPAPSLDENFVRVEIPREPVISEADLSIMDNHQKSVSYTYSDGLGRNTMTSLLAAGPNQEDMVRPSYYNASTGRSDQSYLPYTTTSSQPGKFVLNAYQQSESYYNNPPSGITQDSKAFSITEFDDRGKVKATIAPGENWHTGNITNAKRTNYDYLVHDPSESNPSIDFKVAHWKIENGLPQNDRNYGVNESTVTVITDAQGRKVRTVKDMRGLTITTQSFDPNTQKWYGSYNVYDEFGRIRFVVPPILTASLDNTFPNNFTSDQVSDLMFQYKYDAKGRLTEEKAPGGSWHYFVYDEWDRLVMTHYQGQEWNGSNSWTFYKYDAWNRRIISGQINTSESRSTIQGKVEGSGRFEVDAANNYGYTLDRSFPELPGDYGSYHLLRIQYYDDYSFASNLAAYTPISGFSGTLLTNTINLSTGSKVRMLETNEWLESVIYYDDERRVLQIIADNQLNGGWDRITNEYDWEGKLLKQLSTHSGDANVANNLIDILNEYEYLKNGQLHRKWQTIGGSIYQQDRLLVAEYNYNALGELVEKNLHSTDGNSFLQSVDYRYNIHGALKSINDPSNLSGDNDLFAMDYHYETPISINSANTQPRYDGLVNAITWNATNVTSAVTPTSGPDGQTKTAIAYQYDKRNRLSATTFGQATVASSNYNQKVGFFDMTASYDDNGNIDDLTRKSDNSFIDILDYTYESNPNKLKGVKDTAPEEGGLDDYYTGSTDYEYDPQTGNMTYDMNKQIVEISYNHLRLVDFIAFGDATKIQYTYDAVGNRLSKTILNADGNEISAIKYVGSYEYQDSRIVQIHTEEGRLYSQNGELHHEYFILDHQANNRIAFGDLPMRNVYVASMESRDSVKEKSEFAFPANIRSVAQNHTPLGTESVALNGSVSGRGIGPAKVLTIAAGDEVEMEVWAKYTDSGWNNSSVTNIISTILSTFGGASAGTGLEGASGSLNNTLSSGAPGVFTGSSTGQPEAYLQYLFFDENYNYVSQYSGFRSVGNDSNGQFSKLKSGTATYDQPGYLFVYLVNESDQNKEVYFDDFKIVHSSAESSFKVTQINDYYPFGLPTSNSWRADGYIDPGLLYQSSFANYDSLTGYYDFLSRSYDPVLGRFFAVDPAGQFSSPYLGMGNNPHQVIDPNGEIGFFALPFFKTAFAGVLKNLAFNVGTQALFNGKVDIGSAVTSSLLPGSGLAAANALQGAGNALGGSVLNGIGNGASFGDILGSPGTAFGVAMGAFSGARTNEKLESWKAAERSKFNKYGWTGRYADRLGRAIPGRTYWGEQSDPDGNFRSEAKTQRHKYNYGNSFTIAGNLTLGGGISFEIGWAWDSNGDQGLILSLGPSFGLDASIGYLAKRYYETTGYGFDVTDLQGYGSATSLNVPTSQLTGIDFTFGGNLPVSNDLFNPFTAIGETYYEVGSGNSVGLGIGTWEYTYTGFILFD